MDDGNSSGNKKIVEYFYGKTNFSVWNSTYQYSAEIPGMNSFYGTVETANYDYALRSVNESSVLAWCSNDSPCLFAALGGHMRILTERL